MLNLISRYYSNYWRFMSKKSVLAISFILLLSVVFYFGVKLANFSSDRVWTNVTSNNVPHAVVDTIKKQFKKGVMDNVSILDSSYYGKVSVIITNNHYLLFSFDYCTIYYKESSVTVKKEEYCPPYVIYHGKLYCSLTRHTSNESSLLQMKFINLN